MKCLLLVINGCDTNIRAVAVRRWRERMMMRARLAELCKIVFCGVKTVQNYKSKLDVERNRKNIVIVWDFENFPLTVHRYVLCTNQAAILFVINSAYGPCLEMKMSADPTDPYFLSPTPAPMLTWLRECERPPPVLWREREVYQHSSSRSQLYTLDVSRL